MTDILLESDAPADPLVLFTTWYEAARPLAAGDPTAMTLATADTMGRPAARVVLLKEYGPDGFVFFTNYMSGKAADIEGNPRAALLFWWPPLGRQIRIEGNVERISPEESDTYFASRARLSQIGAWASEQSRVITERDVLDARVKEFDRKFPDAVPRPPHWGGYRVSPLSMEFWQDRASRLHDRLRYIRENGRWRIERLNP